MDNRPRHRIDLTPGARIDPVLGWCCFALPFVVGAFEYAAVICWTEVREFFNITHPADATVYVFAQVTVGCIAGLVARSLQLDDRRRHAALQFTWGNVALGLGMALLNNH